MAEKKTTNKSTKSSTTTTSRSSKSSIWGINKISFYTLAAVAILYLIASILAIVNASELAKVILVLQGIATAVLICIAAYLAWKYVRNKQMVWKVLYFVLLLVLLLGIILPMCL